MFKTVTSSLTVMALAVTPFAAFAQDEEGDEGEAEAVAKVDNRTYPPVNFDQSENPENIWVLDLSNGERVKIRLMEEWAPSHVERIKTLTRDGFYNGVVFHRVIEGFMAQSGDPTGTGQGSSKLPDLNEEFNPMPHVRGTVSMARANEENSANSQFFIVFYPRFSLDKRYTNFGRVIENMGAVDAIVRGEPPANPTRILQASMLSDNLPVPSAAPPRVEPEVTADMLSAPLETQ
ncbi:peptidylprolyl isomerase [Erythrobacter sp. SCSIO 43205]|uniref:peptidylprolyl isomerase n=1 Tax=Erythrobacter sp. SCSIO 43205 TaxID=2779361 RepID=UPI001CA99F43|nr:peptidylprolyl isomerase [Erythrobacter sp. SCSIO 43205]UAB77071.1 peptidylprolyl isomerase [Erythrobacter sp. SCSIO 43205]